MAVAAQRGPQCYENWLLAQGAGPAETYEFPLFSDAVIVGEITDLDGPYQVLNGVRVTHSARVRLTAPALVLRAALCAADAGVRGQMDTDTHAYHGGGLADEVAALLSLLLGRRLMAGGYTRWFQPCGDPRGRPIMAPGADAPTVLLAAWGPSQRVPGLCREADLANATFLATLPKLSPSHAAAVVRAARLYQRAMWIVDEVPDLCWLWLVSAVEAAADVYSQADVAPSEVLRDAKPEFARRLETAGSDEVLELVAAEIAPTLQATRKFLDFLRTFWPAAPSEDRTGGGRLPWESKGKMRTVLSTIYNCRSKALHCAVAFPLPMCEAPIRLGGNVLPEMPVFIASSGRGGRWKAKDAPMYLWVFEYIVRQSLLSWWASVAAEGSADPQQ